MVGVGITLSALRSHTSPVELVSAIVLSVTCLQLANIQSHVAMASAQPQAARLLLLISSVALAIGMVLSAVYAVGHFSGDEFLNIPTMIVFHGLANSGGFALCGLMGWRMSDESETQAYHHGENHSH